MSDKISYGYLTHIPVIATAGFILLFVSTFSALSASTSCLNDIRNKGVILSANSIMGLKPYVWKDEVTEQYQGFEAQIFAEIAKRIGVQKWDYVNTDWSSMIPGLKSGRWDIFISSMFVTQERIQGAGISFTDPYYRLYNVVIVRKDSPIQSIDELKDKTIASVLGTLDSANAHQMKEQGLVAEVLDFNGFGEPYQALRSGQAAAAVMDYLSFQAQSDELDDIRIIGDPIDYTPKPEWADAEAKAPYFFGSLAIGVRKECPDLVTAINKSLSDMQADGTYKSILEKYNVWTEKQAILKK